MKREDFYFDLPQELIAQTPLADRASARLLVLDKETGDITHKTFRDILSYLKKGDCLVLNNTKVLPARLFGERKGTGAKIEVLLLERKNETDWEVLVRPGKKARIGDSIVFGDGILTGEIIATVEGGNRMIRFAFDGVFETILDQLGEMPLPPYITEKLEDKNRYQTVYAKEEGSAAAPTAGLHFTEDLIEEIKKMGVAVVYVTLHVGLGTFRPVKVENILEHEMHREYYIVPEETANCINETKAAGGRIISVGTTSTRTLETAGDETGFVKSGSGWTSIFLYPGYVFQVVDGLVTNFHLPESTLIMLVSALAGQEETLAAYRCAVEERYRFFSFGDAMLIIS